MTVLEQTSKLGLEKLIVLDKLKLLINDFVVTGSISLLAFDYLNRNVGDIDVIIDNLEKINLLKNRGINISESFNYDLDIETKDFIKNDESIKIKIPNRYRIEIDNVPICIFYIKGIRFKEFRFIGNRILKVALPEYTIKSKIKYIENINKLELNSKLSKELEIIKQKYLGDIWFYRKIK